MTDEMKELVRLNVCMRLAAIPPDARGLLKPRIVRQVMRLAKTQPSPPTIAEA